MPLCGTRLCSGLGVHSQSTKKASKAHEEKSPMIGQLKDWETLFKLFGFFVVTPAIAVAAFAFWVDARYAKSSETIALREGPTLAIQKYVQTEIAKLGEITGANAQSINTTNTMVLQNVDDIAELPIRIETYTDCIVRELQDYAAQIALKESSVVGKRQIAKRQELRNLLCSDEEARCGVDAFLPTDTEEKESHSTRITFSQNNMREIDRRIAGCTKYLRSAGE